MVLVWDRVKELDDGADYCKEYDDKILPWFLKKLDYDVLNEINLKALKEDNILKLGN